MDTPADTILLDSGVDPFYEDVDHPLEVTDDEAAAGLAMWEAVDDTDDESNGIEPPPTQIVGLTGRAGAATGYARALEQARWVRDILLDYGVPEVSIELVNGRPAPGNTWNACDAVGVLSHHIASHPTVSNPTPGLSLVKRGRSDLAGPLCNGTAGVDLVYRIICLGYANHSGTGGPLTLRGPLGNYTIPRNLGRAYLWGTEYEGGYTNEVWDKTYTNRRTGKSMTFREFMGRANAGLVEAIWSINTHGRTPRAGMDLSGYHGEHKTWAPGRKPDRKDYSTDSGRAEIRRYKDKDDDMALDDPLYPGKKDSRTVRGVLRRMDKFITRTDARFVKALADLDALAADLEAADNDMPRKELRNRLNRIRDEILSMQAEQPDDTPEDGEAPGEA